jgi:hypothetical protein
MFSPINCHAFCVFATSIRQNGFNVQRFALAIHQRIKGREKLTANMQTVLEKQRAAFTAAMPEAM